MRIPIVNPKMDYVKMGGGLDQVSPALSIAPGSLLACLNYVAGTHGGYQRIDGFERYSGQPSPSDATYTKLTATGTVTEGQTVTGETSGATGVVSRVLSGGFDVTKVSGTFEIEDYSVGEETTGSITVIEEQGAITAEEHAESLNAAADIYRADISAPVGSGALRGIEVLNGVVYCFRDNAGDTAGLIYKATSAGWVEVDLYSEISFDSGIGFLEDGDTITQDTSSATATVRRVVLESGAWGTDASGRLIISDVTGTFTAVDDFRVGGSIQCTATSLETDIEILPGGSYNTIVNNFYASSGTSRIYGCDGVNQGFEFDGTVYVPISTGMPDDTPHDVYTYKNQLFFSFNGSSQNSGVGAPYEWTALTGSSEIGVGDNITGYSQLAGSALGIFSRNSSHQLVGNNVDDFVLSPISDEVGCIPGTIQRLGVTFCLDDRGVIAVIPTDRYGNFEQNTISRKTQPLINQIRQVAVASTTYKTKNQYRIYGSDGTGVCMTLLDRGYAFTSFEYPINVSCAKSGEDSTGKDIVFLGSDDGMVYQANKGSSFDGEEIESYMIFPFNHAKSPLMLKSYLSATLELSSNAYSNFNFSIDFSYGDVDMDTHRSETITIDGGSGFWDVSEWDGFSYDAAFVSSPIVQINGAGTNMNFVLYSKSEIDNGHSLDGVLIKYIPRRLTQ